MDPEWGVASLFFLICPQSLPGHPAPPAFLGPFPASWVTVASFFPQVLLNGTVFARMSPSQKSSLVEEFQKLEWVPSRDPGKSGEGLSGCPPSPSAPLAGPRVLKCWLPMTSWGLSSLAGAPKGCCERASWVSRPALPSGSKSSPTSQQ